jgi:hypothetical protein
MMVAAVRFSCAGFPGFPGFLDFQGSSGFPGRDRNSISSRHPSASYVVRTETHQLEVSLPTPMSFGYPLTYPAYRMT